MALDVEQRNFSDTLRLYCDKKTANVSQEFADVVQFLSLNQSINHDRTLTILENKTRATENLLNRGEYGHRFVFGENITRFVITWPSV